VSGGGMKRMVVVLVALAAVMGLFASPADAWWCGFQGPNGTMTVTPSAGEPGSTVRLTFVDLCNEQSLWVTYTDAAGVASIVPATPGDPIVDYVIPPTAAIGPGSFTGTCRGIGTCYTYFLYSPVAFTVSTPSIRGIVRSSAAPLAGMAVTISSAADPTPVATTSTASDGSFNVYGLADGSYKVHIVDPAQSAGAADYFVNQYYRGASSFATATAVAVQAPSMALLDKITLAWTDPGSVSGSVTNGSVGLASIYVVLAPVGSTIASGLTQTAADGTYTIGGLAPGQYHLAAVDGAWLQDQTAGYLPDLFKGYGPSLDLYDQSTLLTVSPGGTTAVVTIALTHGHTITTWVQGGLGVPARMAFAPSGDLYYADDGNHKVHKIDAAGTVTLIAGSPTGVAGFAGDGGPASGARLSLPRGLAVDGSGNVYIADTGNNRIRRIDAVTGIITTVAGNGSAGFSGEYGMATAAMLHGPSDVTVDAAGNLYVSDTMNARVRKVTAATQKIHTIAGNGTSSAVTTDGVLATTTTLCSPSGLTLDTANNLYIVDPCGDRVRKLNAVTRILTTVAGTGIEGFNGDGPAASFARLKNPFDVVVDTSGNLYISDQSNFRVRRVTLSTGRIRTVAGTGLSGFTGDGVAEMVRLAGPGGVAVDAAGTLVINDYANGRMRRLSSPAAS